MGKRRTALDTACLSLLKWEIPKLAGLSLVDWAHNVVILGSPGVGKTHLAALGTKTVEAGYYILILRLETLMMRLTKAQHENHRDRTLNRLIYPKVLMVDEIGCLSLSREDASLSSSWWCTDINGS